MTEARLAFLREAVKQSYCATDRLTALARFLRACEVTQRERANRLRYNAYVEVAYLLGDRVCDGPVWDWLEEQAREAPAGRRENLRIAIFEWIPDSPIFWPDLFRLWDLWFDPATRWAVYSAYFSCPRRVHVHLRRYCAHRRREKKSLPQFSQSDFEQCLHEIRGGGDSTS